MRRFRKLIGRQEPYPPLARVAMPRVYRIRAARVQERVREGACAHRWYFNDPVVLECPCDRWYAKVRYGRVGWFRWVAWAFNGLAAVFLAALAITEATRLWDALLG